MFLLVQKWVNTGGKYPVAFFDRRIEAEAYAKRLENKKFHWCTFEIWEIEVVNRA